MRDNVLSSFKRLLSVSVLVFSLLFVSVGFVSCGSGGGGGDDRRTRDTAIRIIHGSVDGAPVQLQLSEEVLLKAAFVEGTSFQRIDAGSVSLNVERANSRGVGLGLLNADLENETEYTIFVNGEARTGEINARLLTEPVVEPEEGMARIQFLHGVESQGSLGLRIAGNTSALVRRGQTSGFFEIPFGTQSFQVVNADGGVLTSGSLELEDKSELTVLAAGDSALGFVVTRSFVDFD